MNTPLEIYEYLKPRINSCAGFIKTNGDMLAIWNDLYVASADRCFISVINLDYPVQYPFSSSIKRFIGYKEEPEECLNRTISLNNNRIYNELLQLGKSYKYVGLSQKPLYTNDDLLSNDIFNSSIDMKSAEGILFMKFIYNGYKYMIPCAKAITPVNKGDSVSLYIYNTENPEINIVRYITHKKKFKTDINLYFRIMISKI